MSTPMKCTISVNGREEGPISFEEVLARLGRGDIQLTDYMYNETLKDWVALLEVPAIQNHFRANKPGHKPAPKAGADLTAVHSPVRHTSALGDVRDWFVLKWDTRVGPFSTLDLIRMLQEKAIFEFEFVCKQGMDAWKRIADLEDFQNLKMRQLFEKEKGQIFIPREHPRVPFKIPFMAHDGTHLWQGHGLEVSLGGARVKMDYAPLLPGQIVTLHLNGSRDLEAMNIQCEIVGKKFRAGKLERFSTVEYLLKFMSLEDRHQLGLKTWITARAV